MYLKCISKVSIDTVKNVYIHVYILFSKCIYIRRGDRGIMGHGELRTSVIFLKTVSNYCPKTFFFEFSYRSPIFGTPVELRTRILTVL